MWAFSRQPLSDKNNLLLFVMYFAGGTYIMENESY